MNMLHVHIDWGSTNQNQGCNLDRMGTCSRFSPTKLLISSTNWYNHPHCRIDTDIAGEVMDFGVPHKSTP